MVPGLGVIGRVVSGEPRRASRKPVAFGSKQFAVAGLAEGVPIMLRDRPPLQELVTVACKNRAS